MTSRSTFSPHIKAVKWDSSRLGVPGVHRRSGYFYGSPADSSIVWDIHWKRQLEKEARIKQMHSIRAGREQVQGHDIEKHDVFLAHHVAQGGIANRINERLQANGYNVYSNSWFCRQNSPRAWKGTTSAWEKSNKPWRSAESQHLSPNRPTKTGAEEEELRLRECKSVVAIVTKDAMASNSFLREVKTARRLGMKIICVHSFPVHREYAAATLCANAILVPWELPESGGGEGVDGQTADAVVKQLQLLGIHASAFDGLMSAVGKNVGIGSPKAKHNPLLEATQRPQGDSSISVFPPISPNKGKAGGVEPGAQRSVSALDDYADFSLPLPVVKMNEEELQEWLGGVLQFAPEIVMKFRGIKSGLELCRLRVNEVVARCHVTEFVAKKVVRVARESNDPSTETFLSTYNKGVRSNGGEMKRAADMTVGEVQSWASALHGLGSTRAAKAKCLLALEHHGVNGADLIELNKQDLLNIGFCLADATFFLQECQTLKFHGIPPAYLSSPGKGPLA